MVGDKYWVSHILYLRHLTTTVRKVSFSEIVMAVHATDLFYGTMSKVRWRKDLKRSGEELWYSKRKQKKRSPWRKERWMVRERLNPGCQGRSWPRWKAKIGKCAVDEAAGKLLFLSISQCRDPMGKAWLKRGREEAATRALVIVSYWELEARVGRPEYVDGLEYGWESSQAHSISGLGRWTEAASIWGLGRISSRALSETEPPAVGQGQVKGWVMSSAELESWVFPSLLQDPSQGQSRNLDPPLLHSNRTHGSHGLPREEKGIRSTCADAVVTHTVPSCPVFIS